MHYLMCKQKVTDYGQWKQVFDSHAASQAESGLHLLHVLRDVDDPNTVVVLMRADDLGKARAFTEAPAASAGADSAGVIGVPEVSFFSD